MTNNELMMKLEVRKKSAARFSSCGFRHSFVIRHSSFVILFSLFSGILLRYGECASPPPTPAVVDNRLPAPQAESERKYLGLSSTSERFSLDNVQADILVLDFFDMYCHVCQSRAKHMNDFYQLVQSRGLGSRVKVLGVGVGDTPKEVTVFKEKFGLPFPVFPDRTGSFSKQFGKIKVPNVILLKKRLGRFQVVYQESSLPDNAEQFLSKVLSYATTKVSVPVADTAKCIDNGTTKCPIVLSGQPDKNGKRKLNPSEQEGGEGSR